MGELHSFEHRRLPGQAGPVRRVNKNFLGVGTEWGGTFVFNADTELPTCLWRATLMYRFAGGHLSFTTAHAGAI